MTKYMKTYIVSGLLGAGLVAASSGIAAAGDPTASIHSVTVDPSSVRSSEKDKFQIAYTVKFVCGTNPVEGEEPFGLFTMAPGTYTTVINVLNPSLPGDGLNDSVEISAEVLLGFGRFDEDFPFNQQFPLKQGEVLDSNDMEVIECGNILLNLVGGVVPEDLEEFVDTFLRDSFVEGDIKIVIDRIESKGIFYAFEDVKIDEIADYLNVDAFYTMKANNAL